MRGPGDPNVCNLILVIKLPYVEIVDNIHHIASLTEQIDLCIGLQQERNRGYRIIIGWILG